MWWRHEIHPNGVTLFRVTLIAYLMVATLAGPAWCCCTLGRVVACVLPARAEQETVEPVCCCCCVKPTVVVDETTKPAPDSQDRHEPCPCKETREAQSTYYIAPNRAELDEGGSPFDALSWNAAVVFEMIPVPSLHDARTLDTSPPSRSGRDLLLAIQVFRC